MKKIFRYTRVGVLFAALLAIGAVSALAQDNCADAAGQTALSDKIRAIFADKSAGALKTRITMSKEFLEKYGACESAKEFSDYLKPNVPKWEAAAKGMDDIAAKKTLIDRFNASLIAKNWNETYASGQEILQKYPDEFRTVVLVLGSIGLDETAKTPRVTTWNENTLRFARQAIADLESGKEFKTFGVPPFTYKNKEDALGWMNYTIGYISFFDKNDKKLGLSNMYKATQIESTTKNNPVLYQAIGSYYFDEVKRLAGEVTALEKKQDPNATEEVAKALVAEIKAKVALVNGTAEAAIDAYARAHKLADPTPKGKEYRDSLYKTIGDLYNVRFGKMDGLDAFIAKTTAKPMPNPLNPVTPISDPEPATTTTTSTTRAGTSLGVPSGTGIGMPSGTSVGRPNGTGVGAAAAAKSATTTKPAAPIKP